ncbi:MAG: hypothetical protein J07HX5_01710 [halophilic archaeon J07HX5]|nr:MAG: hypothetical protein J07HX5_01710 [halophilic archaeon J07HX5]
MQLAEAVWRETLGLPEPEREQDIFIGQFLVLFMSEQTDRQLDARSRRRFLTAAATIGATAVAGCSNVTNQLADAVVDDVVVQNTRESKVGGQINITTPTGTIGLEETFDLNDKDEGNIQLYEDVWTTEGSYEASLKLTRAGFDGMDSVTETVSVATPEEETLTVKFTADETKDPITLCVQDDPDLSYTN